MEKLRSAWKTGYTRLGHPEHRFYYKGEKVGSVAEINGRYRCLVPPFFRYYNTLEEAKAFAELIIDDQHSTTKQLLRETLKFIGIYGMIAWAIDTLVGG